jgi:hypothetical protein
MRYARFRSRDNIGLMIPTPTHVPRLRLISTAGHLLEGWYVSFAIIVMRA